MKREKRTPANNHKNNRSTKFQKDNNKQPIYNVFQYFRNRDGTHPFPITDDPNLFIPFIVDTLGNIGPLSKQFLVSLGPKCNNPFRKTRIMRAISITSAFKLDQMFAYYDAHKIDLQEDLNKAGDNHGRFKLLPPLFLCPGSRSAHLLKNCSCISLLMFLKIIQSFYY
jgi:hypothetical protein